MKNLKILKRINTIKNLFGYKSELQLDKVYADNSNKNRLLKTVESYYNRALVFEKTAGVADDVEKIYQGWRREIRLPSTDLDVSEFCGKMKSSIAKLDSADNPTTTFSNVAVLLSNTNNAFDQNFGFIESMSPEDTRYEELIPKIQEISSKMRKILEDYLNDAVLDDWVDEIPPDILMNIASKILEKASKIEKSLLENKPEMNLPPGETENKIEEEADAELAAALKDPKLAKALLKKLTRESLREKASGDVVYDPQQEEIKRELSAVTEMEDGDQGRVAPKSTDESIAEEIEGEFQEIDNISNEEAEIRLVQMSMDRVEKQKAQAKAWRDRLKLLRNYKGKIEPRDQLMLDRAKARIDRFQESRKRKMAEDPEFAAKQRANKAGYQQKWRMFEDNIESVKEEIKQLEERIENNKINIIEDPWMADEQPLARLQRLKNKLKSLETNVQKKIESDVAEGEKKRVLRGETDFTGKGDFPAQVQKLITHVPSMRSGDIKDKVIDPLRDRVIREGMEKADAYKGTEFKQELDLVVSLRRNDLDVLKSTLEPGAKITASMIAESLSEATKKAIGALRKKIIDFMDKYFEAECARIQEIERFIDEYYTEVHEYAVTLKDTLGDIVYKERKEPFSDEEAEIILSSIDPLIERGKELSGREYRRRSGELRIHTNQVLEMTVLSLEDVKRKI